MNKCWLLGSACSNASFFSTSSIQYDPSLQCVRVWIRRENINKKPMNHLKAGECDHSSWGSPQKVGSTSTVKPSKALLLEYFLDTISYARVPLLRVVALFLKPRAYHLQILWQKIMSLCCNDYLVSTCATTSNKGTVVNLKLKTKW